MPTSKPRVQVTIDEELAAALDEIDPRPRSQSRLLRDLALRGAEAEAEAREIPRGIEYLRGIATGDVDYDFDASRAAWKAREANA